MPGALPPVTGWVAAHGGFGVEAWVLFAILFLWQLPHSLAIARLYRDDYASAGIRLLPVVEPDAQEHRPANRDQLPGAARRRPDADAGRPGRARSTSSSALRARAARFLGYGIAFSLSRTAAAARQLLFASLLYLPVAA